MAPKFVVDPTAVARVKNPLPVPEQCPRCSGTSVLVVNNSAIYGKQYGKWPFAYYCDGCGAYVGMHPGTNIPLGTLADEATRAARRDCKTPFEQMWKNGHMSRTEAYSWLADRMGIATDSCHFGWFEVAQCNQAKSLCEEYLCTRAKKS